MTPLNDRVFVKQAEAPDTAGDEGLIVMPETSKEDARPLEGDVIAVGPGRPLNPPVVFGERLVDRLPVCVKAGDRVLFARYAGTRIEHSEHGEILILSEKDLLGVVG
jgi:chaperonin GroES